MDEPRTAIATNEWGVEVSDIHFMYSLVKHYIEYYELDIEPEDLLVLNRIADGNVNLYRVNLDYSKDREDDKLPQKVLQSQRTQVDSDSMANKNPWSTA